MAVVGLCGECNEILLKLSAQYEEGLEGDTSSGHSTKAALVQSASRGCALCTIICNALPGDEEQPAPVGNDAEASFALRFAEYLNEDDDHRTIVAYLLRADLPDILSSLRLLPISYFGLKAFKQLSQGSSTSSSETHSLIRRWIDACDSSHRKCKEHLQQNSFFPKRVIDVGTLEEPRLCLVEKSPNQVGPYVTLSHCWGKRPLLRLLKSNIVSMKENIEKRPQQLPPTFRDAVNTTRTIGIKYLWIDSLCIIQDSEEDWNEQAPLMSDIYSSAYCNVAATKSSNSGGGLYATKNSAFSGIDHINIATKDEGSWEYLLLDEYYWKTRVDNAPLNSRGWVLQERVLSPRVIHFSYDQALWECSETQASEAYPDSIPLDTIEISNKSTASLLNSREAALQLWYQCLEVYSSKGLTYGKDKLMAISGIARRCKPLMRGRYYAGIWETDFIHGLLWYFTNNTTVKRRTTYRAPSWSWASMIGHFYIIPNDGHKSTIETAEVIECSVTNASNDEFSQVKGARLLLAGKLATYNIPSGASLSNRSYSGFPSPLFACWDWPPPMKVTDQSGSDGLARTKEDQLIYFAPLRYFTHMKSNGATEEGLMLIEADDEPRGTYRRIGYFNVSVTGESVSQLETEATVLPSNENPRIYLEDVSGRQAYCIV